MRVPFLYHQKYVEVPTKM